MDLNTSMTFSNLILSILNWTVCLQHDSAKSSEGSFLHLGLASKFAQIPLRKVFTLGYIKCNIFLEIAVCAL